ncbi:hypothetical protein U27_04022 [Candidatus Vecturithrix granuli]|uniref:Uncharacterized protein n=1 Tax=Vecturithrix granuli TaxID=1499967 RepID=A0A081BXK3_VECG1|nr:hypothetical protein U27_04022 [Candidatus Vecturithrix granuli]
MRKKQIIYDSPVDALVALAKRLSVYETQYRMESEEFFDQYSKGQKEDTLDFVEWSNNYQHYLEMKLEIERQLRHAA